MTGLPFVAAVLAYAYLIVQGFPLAALTALVAGLFVEVLDAHRRKYG